MLVEIFTISILFLITLLYFLVIKPVRTMRRLTKDFQRQGYKVYTFPYRPFDQPAFRTLLIDSETGNPYKTFSTKFVEYDIIVSYSMKTPLIALLSPRARKELIKHQIDYDHQKLPFFVNLFFPVLGKGLLFSQGHQWKRKRRIMSSFFTFEFLQSKIPQIRKIIETSLDEFQMESQKNKSNEDLPQNEYRFKLIDLTTRMFSNVILSLFLGTQSLEEEINGEKVYKFMLDLVTDRTLRNFQNASLIFGYKYLGLGLTAVDRDINRRIKLYNDWADKYVDKLIQKAAKTQKPTNLLQLLYQSKSDNQNNYTKEELMDQLKIFFFAGTDTTSHLLEMMIYLSVKNKQSYQKVKEEVQNMKKNIQNIDSLKQLRYVEAIQKETMRFYGPLSLNFKRIAIKNHFFDKVFIPKGTIIEFYSICTHYNPEYYPQPFSFNPDRWLDKEREIDAAYLTGFGMGPRSCIGQTLANIESKVGYFTFLNRYSEIRVPEKVDLKFKFMNEAQDLYVEVRKKTRQERA